jgi:AraC-like DNA-binding protein
MQAVYEKVPATTDGSFVMFVRRDKGFPFRWHFHPEYELTLIVRSRGQRFVGDNIAGYGPGDLVLLGPNLPHTWDSDDTGQQHEAIVIQFKGELLGRGPEFKTLDRLLRQSHRGLQFTGATRQRVATQLRRLPRQRGLPRLLALFEILHTLATTREVRILSSPGFTPSLRHHEQARIDVVCNHIHAHLAERLSLPDLARRAGMSPRAFRRFFKRVLGKSLVQYLNELRIGQACAQLINTDRSVTEICYATGFNNLAYFNRRFRALKRVTPRQYRRAHSR